MAGTIAGRFCNKWNQLINNFKYLNLSCAQQHSFVNQVRFVSLDSFQYVQSKKDGSPPSSLSQRPKFPANVFLVYLAKMAPFIQKDNPELKRKQIVSKAAQMWKELDPEVKSQLAVERKETMEKYKEDLKQFLQSLTPEQYSELEVKKKANILKHKKLERKTLGFPKKPGGSFGIFAMEMFSERSDEKVTLFFKRLADRWSLMSDSEKEPYIKKAEKNRAAYAEEMEKWEKEMMSLGRFDLVRKGSLRKLTQTKFRVKKTGKAKTVTAEDVQK